MTRPRKTPLKAGKPSTRCYTPGKHRKAPGGPEISGKRHASGQAYPKKARGAGVLAELDRKARLAAEATPPRQSREAEWADPDDQANTRTPKRVRGRARGAVLRRLHARGDDVTRDHLEAATLFACAWDAARLGYTAAGGVADSGGSAPGPRLAPPAHTLAREAQARDVRRVLMLLGAAAVPLLVGVVIEDLDIAAWCDREATRREDNKRPDPKKALGRLVGILDRLCELYGIDERLDRVKAARASLAQR